MSRTECSSTKVSLCLTPSFVRLAEILQRSSRRSSLSESSLSLPSQRGRLFGDVIEERYYTGLDYDTGLISTAEIEKEKTYVLRDDNIVTVVELKSTAEIDKEKTHVLPDGNIIMLAPNVPVAWKCCSMRERKYQLWSFLSVFR